METKQNILNGDELYSALLVDNALLTSIDLEEFHNITVMDNGDGSQPYIEITNDNLDVIAEYAITQESSGLLFSSDSTTIQLTGLHPEIFNLLAG